jgi:hypothetical protein
MKCSINKTGVRIDISLIRILFKIGNIITLFFNENAFIALNLKHYYIKH